MVEVMVAVLLSAIAVMGVMGLYSAETRGGTVARHSTEASVLAQDKMEQLRATSVPTAGSESNLDATGATVSGAMYSRSWTVTSTAPYTYTVTVSWSEDGVAKTVTLRSTRNGSGS